MTEPRPHTWLELDLGLGDTRLPVRLAVRLDGLALLEVGEENVMGVYDTMLDSGQLDEFIRLLQLAHDLMVAAQKDEGHE